jgi:Alpha/beta hydrolase domain
MNTLTRGAFGAWLFVVAVSTASAQATLSDVSFTTPQIGGKSYFEVTATMNGPSATPYSVPILLLYPVNPAESNGTAVVDLLNNTPMRLRAADTGGAQFVPPVPIGRVLLSDDFIGEHGYVYVGIQWDREMIPFMNFHQATSFFIPTAGDQISIVLDVGALLQQLPPSLPGTPVVSKRIAFGFSAPGWVLLEILEHPVLRTAFSARFDGAMLGAVGKRGQPYASPQGTPSKSGGAQPAVDVKTIVLMAETEIQFFDGKFLRGESSSYRSYEVAGAAHNPTDLIPLGQFAGLPGVSSTIRQNPVSLGPVYRAMMEHLRNWTLGNGAPPPSVALGNPFNTNSNVDFTPVVSGVEHIEDVPRSASDGLALGGIRLPPVVVPVAFHNGLELVAGMPYSATTFGQIISGTFEAFSTSELGSRYPTHADYVQEVTAAADAALAAGWILPSDRDWYVATAAACAVGTGVVLTPAQILACFGL